jgi:O-antigen/teichoic acid export membrane protein
MPYKKFTQRIWLIGFTQGLLFFGSLIFIPIITKTLGAYEYGVWAQLMVTIFLFTPMVMLGLQSTIIRFLAGQKKKKYVKIYFL